MYRASNLLTKIRGRSYSIGLTANQLDALDIWIASHGRLVLSDRFTEDRLSDLYITLPTRDGTSAVYREPQDSQPVGYGHHLAFFHPRTPETKLRPDGTDPVLCPPEPFTRRMWAGGAVIWNNANPLLVGSKAKATSTTASIDKKGFEKGTPMIFVNQQIQVAMQGSSEPSLTETRSHVYLPSTSRPSNRPREVNDIPPQSDFSFTYLPTLTTLFRFSALTFNAHHIHLDKDITNGEGYPERLVHGPLTALMLLETATLNNPALKIKSFEYRAVNPMIVNHRMTIHGAWLDDVTARLWCIDQNGIVGMVGTIRKDV
ncbi:hypothetical protein JOM56_003500 [Amanita muscaria]